jgi:hypothetical protein
MSSGSGSAAVTIWSPAWISMVWWRRRLVMSFLIDQSVRRSSQRVTARAAKTMVRWASIESRLWW